MVPIGLSPSDFKEAIRLSWKLYDSLKNAPEEVKDLAKDLSILSGVLNQIQADLDKGSDSEIAAHGERRIKLLQSITADLMRTLAEAQTLVDKFRPLATAGRISEELWRKIKFMMSQRKIHAIQKSITAHISAFSLLLTSMGNSSLCRMEESLRELRLEATSAMTDFSGSVDGVENEEAIRGPTKAWAEEDHVGGNTSQQPPGVPPSSPPVLHRQPPPAAKTVLLDPQITDALEIEVGTLPSQEFLLFMRRLPSRVHADIANIIFSNCKVTCFNFYRLHGLYRTKFGRGDSSFERKLFQLSHLSSPVNFPQTEYDLSLDEWTSKLVHAYARINEPDAIHASHLYDYMYSTKVFSRFPQITSLVDAWGNVKADKVEECLVYSLALCRVLKGWDSLDRLKALWAAIHRPESPFINKAMLMPPWYAQPPARDDDSAVDQEDLRPPKRTRIESGTAKEASEAMDEESEAS
ncbi:hypothetical protein DL764_002776 [Monosporascus ibericus]|uniref:Fungal N-terminal domain-containing protein n=1 Tax=Monosporascus ibericus TaxID=155417 RepID=A0A4Q4TNY2_9PEZI|nr:hypothetical protein DL764_002776 [Monosporascus ibericus]